ncbi:MAG: hypothetical protein ACRDMV_01885 [Streptosporangiales bacterium]
MLSPTTMTLARIVFAALAVIGLLWTYAGWFTKPAVAEPSAPATVASATHRSPPDLT